ncbi:MAG: hypothetical protein CMI32_05925 [Opitutales bacterium]|nr:hypothetical protein [Opitutales bacterium]|tara:strand:- start:2061 stop:2516 length:456 start_codon:yes stop_codon:yes gene_type:complete
MLASGDETNYLIDLTISEALSEPIYLGAVALLFCLIGLLVLARKLKTELIPAFEDNEGSVHLTPQALHELVRKSCEQIEEVKSRNTRISMERGKLSLNVRLQVNGDCKINEIRARLKKHLRIVLVDNLGLKNFGGVNITVVGFKSVDLVAG